MNKNFNHIQLAATALLMMLLTTATTAWAWDGSGTTDTPYLIKTTADLDLLAQQVNSGTGDADAATGYSGKYFQLDADIAYAPAR